MKTVWKFPLQPWSLSYPVQMPIGAEILSVHEQNETVCLEILSVHEQNETVCLWALVDPKAHVEFRTFVIVGTGLPFESDGLKFLGTAHLAKGALVLHVFERYDRT